MPPTTEAPQHLRPYLFHRVDITWQGTADANGTCPFCNREKKFFISQAAGLYDCKVCGERGNVYTFLRKLAEVSTANPKQLELVAEERRVSVETLCRWGLTQSAIDKEWILPAYGGKGEVNNIYRWSFIKDKRRMLSTPGMSQCLFGLNLWDNSKPEAIICEGPWDGMALEDEVRSHRIDEYGDLVATAPQRSLGVKINVVAVPGCETFKDDWLIRFKGKHVTLIYDNDHPKVNKQTGKLTEPAGLTGMKKAAKLLKAVATSVRAIRWGEEWWSSEYPDGHDVRDFLQS